jgi:hypothetical protein
MVGDVEIVADLALLEVRLWDVVTMSALPPTTNVAPRATCGDQPPRADVCFCMRLCENDSSQLGSKEAGELRSHP